MVKCKYMCCDLSGLFYSIVSFLLELNWSVRKQAKNNET